MMWRAQVEASFRLLEESNTETQYPYDAVFINRRALPTSLVATEDLYIISTHKTKDNEKEDWRLIRRQFECNNDTLETGFTQQIRPSQCICKRETFWPSIIFENHTTHDVNKRSSIFILSLSCTVWRIAGTLFATHFAQSSPQIIVIFDFYNTKIGANKGTKGISTRRNSFKNNRLGFSITHDCLCRRRCIFCISWWASQNRWVMEKDTVRLIYVFSFINLIISLPNNLTVRNNVSMHFRDTINESSSYWNQHYLICSHPFVLVLYQQSLDLTLSIHIVTSRISNDYPSDDKFTRWSAVGAIKTTLSMNKTIAAEAEQMWIWEWKFVPHVFRRYYSGDVTINPSPYLKC